MEQQEQGDQLFLDDDSPERQEEDDEEQLNTIEYQTPKKQKMSTDNHYQGGNDINVSFSSLASSFITDKSTHHSFVSESSEDKTGENDDSLNVCDNHPHLVAVLID